MSDRDVVLVTGASSGIGRATASLLARSGRRVFGTSRTPEGVEPLDDVTLLRLDVDDGSSVETCVDEVLETAGRIDLLINNAGYTVTGPAEATTLEQAKAQFETNVFGAMRVTSRVLPGMRDRGSGRIVFVSSIAGFVGVPFLGVYSASKFALEGYAEALHHEVAPFGVDVTIVEPGFVRTNLPEAIVEAAAEVDGYDPWLERWNEAIGREVEAADEAELVAVNVLAIAEEERPMLRCRVGDLAREMSERRRRHPEASFLRAVARRFGLSD